MTTHAERSAPYQFFMLALCVWALVDLGVASMVQLPPATALVIDYADTAICILFLGDFCYSLWRAPRKLHYLRTWGWIDFLSSIPAIDVLRWGRTARVLRILRVLRGMKSARTIAHFLVARRSQSAVLATTLLSLLLVTTCSIAVLQFEPSGGGNIQSAEDALWWAVSTMTTVGYGDRYPVTSEGRLIAVFLMAAGVGVFGLLSGLVASWFLSPEVQETDSDLQAVRTELRLLREQLAMNDTVNKPTNASRA